MRIDADDRRAGVLAELLPDLRGDARLEAAEQMLRACLGTRVVRIKGGGPPERQNLDRAFLLDRIADSALAVHALGGPDAVAETARAIQETAAAWP